MKVVINCRFLTESYYYYYILIVRRQHLIRSDSLKMAHWVSIRLTIDSYLSFDITE